MLFRDISQCGKRIQLGIYLHLVLAKPTKQVEKAGITA
jgi:hypothetical protein